MLRPFCLGWSRANQAWEFARIIVEAWKHRRQILHTEMFGQDLTDYRTKIRGQRQVASFVELVLVQPRPMAINTASLYVSTEDKHAIREAVVRAPIAVFLGGTPELAHGHHHNLTHAVSHVLR